MKRLLGIGWLVEALELFFAKDPALAHRRPGPGRRRSWRPPPIRPDRVRLRRRLRMTPAVLRRLHRLWDRRWALVRQAARDARARERTLRRFRASRGDVPVRRVAA